MGEVLQAATEDERLGGIQSPQLLLHVQRSGMRCNFSRAPGCLLRLRHRGCSRQPVPLIPSKFAYSSQTIPMRACAFLGSA